MRKKKRRALEEYCCGCGLCASIYNVSFSMVNGFYTPNLKNEHVDKLVKICPIATAYKRNNEHICGPYSSVWIGASSNDEIRRKSSSGGVLTSLAIYLLESKKIDGVLQIKAREDKPWATKVVCSTTVKEILECAGSRYAQSLTLSTLEQYLAMDEKFLLIGKPCDIRALRNYAEEDSRVSERIPYMFSFFCMGTPSENANLELLRSLDCTEAECVGLRYRGEGWPGYTTVITRNGSSHTMTYNESWGGILGRDLRKYCRFCMDGFGDAADISCGDAWYLDENSKPIFDENNGRNVVFARTEKGEELIKGALEEKIISLEDFSHDLTLLKYMQKSQYNRKEMMRYRQLAMKIMCKGGPRYKRKYLKEYSKNISFVQGLDAFLGTLSRILKGKM